VPRCDGSEIASRLRVNHPGFSFVDAAVIVFLTITMALALSIGAQNFSARTIVFLVIMNAASLALGRATLRIEIVVFREFAEFVLGVCIFSLITFAVCRLFTADAAAGAAVAIIASILAAAICISRGRREPAGSWLGFGLAKLICVAGFIWSWQAILAVPHMRATGTFTAWTDYFIHASELAQFAHFSILHGGSIFAAGAKLPLYHYGSYMIPAALVGIAGTPALVAATVLWTLLGFIILGLGTATLGAMLAGEAGGILAVLALLLLPDAAHYSLKNPFFDFHWLMQVSASSCYGVALACLSIAAMLRWLRNGAASDLAWAAGLTLAVFEFRVHVFAVLAITNALLFVAAWRPAQKWQRPAVVLLGLALATLTSIAVEFIPRAPHFWSGPHHPVATLVQMLGMPPSPHADLFKNLAATVPPAGFPHSLWTAAILMAGLALLLIAAFGALIFVYAAGLIFAIRRGAAAEDFVPLTAIAAYLFIVAAFPDTPSEPFEFAHRPFVFPYTLLAIWCARDITLWLSPLFSGSYRRWIPLGLATLLLVVPLSLQATAQSSMLQWRALFSQFAVPPALQAGAAFIRAHSKAGAVIANQAGPLDEVFQALTERPALSPGTIFLQLQSGITAPDAANRRIALARALAGNPVPGVQWIVIYPGTKPPAPPTWTASGYAAIRAAPP
jgi:hypothetical protein